MYKLIIEDDEGKTTVVPLIRDEITIGRKEGNTIRLTERNVSRKHARLLKSNGAVFIEDCSSYNGIKVNGERIGNKAPIAEGDRIQIGDYQLALKLDRAAAEEADSRTTPYAREEAPRGGMNGTAIVEAPRLPGGASGTAPAASVLQVPQAPPPPSSTAGLGEERPARLVVVSSNFAGQEFTLGKAEVVIGRTGENDIVIDHRSISRNHAKILREGGRYQVQDLGSANRVRVNGEEYKSVELRKGDLIDLGHVRLRFVAPGEDFVFARDVKVVDLEEAAGEGKKSKGLVIGIVAGACLLVGGAVLVFGGGKGGKGEESPTTTAQAGSASAAEANVAVDRAMKALDWDTAIAEADKGLRAAPSDDLLRDKKARSEAEKKVQPAYDAYSAAVKANDADTAVLKYQQIPDNSVYHAKAQETWAPVKKAYVAANLAKARAFQAAGKCDEAKHHLEAVLLIEENAEAQDLAHKCGQAPAAVPSPHVAAAPRQPKPTTAPSPTPTPTPTPTHATSAPEPAPAPAPAPKPAPAPTPAPAAAGGNADALVTDAQDNYVRGNYQNAIDIARKALRVDASNSKAWRIVGASSCFLKDKGGAATAWNKLGNMDRNFLKYVCGRNAITIP